MGRLILSTEATTIVLLLVFAAGLWAGWKIRGMLDG